MNLPRITGGTPNSPHNRDDLGWFNNTQIFLGVVAVMGMGAHALSHWGDGRMMLRSLCLSAIVAGGCVAAGALVGFIFGIPRTLASGKGDGDGDPGAAGGTRSNTNLERVSDWLTGMIVGAGLIELQKLLETFRNVASTLARGFSDGDAGKEPFAYAYAMFLMVLAGVSGFLIGYIITRRFLPLTFARGESAAVSQERENKMLSSVTRLFNSLRSEQPVAPRPEEPAQANMAIVPAAGAGELTEPKAAAPADAPAIPTAKSSLPQSKTEDDDDPHKGKFGRSPVANGRRLSAKVFLLSGDESGAGTAYYRVILRVASEDARRPLTAPVDFHLHPTFSRPIESVTPINGEAVLELIVWGSFTVGAVTDDGSTRLELDLAELPGVPEKFRVT